MSIGATSTAVKVAPFVSSSLDCNSYECRLYRYANPSVSLLLSFMRRRACELGTADDDEKSECVHYGQMRDTRCGWCLYFFCDCGGRGCGVCL